MNGYRRYRRRDYGAIKVFVLLLPVFALAVYFMLGLMAEQQLPERQPEEGAFKAMALSHTPEPELRLEIEARNAIVINASTGDVVFQKAADERIAPASTTKLLTALTALELLSPEESVTVGREIEAMAEDSSRAWLNAGDELSVRQLLVALLLPSGNDAAFTLAENAGGLESFIRVMNSRARELGAVSSNFATPDGYDAPEQYTTAGDLALIAKACLENDCIAEIVGSYSVYDVWLGGREVSYYNTNELLNPQSEFYRPEVIGLKTGNSGGAGACLISAAVIDGETYISVVMGGSEIGRFSDSCSIFDAIKER